LSSGLILPYGGVTPSIAAGAYVAPGAVVAGDVVIGAGSGVWFNCTIRGDVNVVRIGERTNIQDGTVIHVTTDGNPTLIGAGVTVGHAAILHACTLEDGCFVGMGAILLDGVVVESGAMVAAGAVVPPGRRVPAGEVWAGNPARLLRPLSEAERAFIPVSAARYVDLAARYRCDRAVADRRPGSD
jgi:carbonic anhydrase/acetyltransferase-like protein (isoleucine patch superfamily)